MIYFVACILIVFLLLVIFLLTASKVFESDWILLTSQVVIKRKHRRDYLPVLMNWMLLP